MSDDKTVAQVQKELRKSNKMFGKEFIEVPKNHWARDVKNMVAVFRNRDFMVQIYDEEMSYRLSINRTQINDKGKFKDNIGWDDLQKIKNAVGFEDDLAVEVYPSINNLVNVANMRHLWVMKTALKIGWVKSLEGSNALY